MRFFAVLAFIVSAAAPAAIAQTQGGYRAASHGPVTLAPVDVVLATSPIQAGQASMGHEMCLDSYQGLPETGDASGRPLILWRCHGRNNQHVALKDGVLYIGAAETHRIEPMAALAEGCDWRELASVLRAYQVGVCREEAASAQQLMDFPDVHTARLGSIAEPGVTNILPGAPLVVVPIEPGATPAATWEYVRRTQQLRLSGTNLCLTPPTRDLSEGAPLYLDYCDQPYRLSEAQLNDGPRRSRVRFNVFWR